MALLIASPSLPRAEASVVRGLPSLCCKSHFTCLRQRSELTKISPSLCQGEESGRAERRVQQGRRTTAGQRDAGRSGSAGSAAVRQHDVQCAACRGRAAAQRLQQRPPNARPGAHDPRDVPAAVRPAPRRVGNVKTAHSQLGPLQRTAARRHAPIRKAAAFAMRSRLFWRAHVFSEAAADNDWASAIDTPLRR